MSDSTIAQTLISQYGASLAMLKQSIEICPDALWLDPNYPNKFWHIAYHALFYTHFYVQASDKEFVPWARHQADSNFLGARPWAPDEQLPAIEPYTRQDLLAYQAFCCEEVAAKVPQFALDGPSGFHWLPFSRLGAHLYSLRHLAHHTGQLTDRIRNVAGTGVSWVLQG